MAPKSKMWTPLHAKIHRTIRSRHLFERNGRLLVAVSGGQDSLCLIKLLLDLQPKWGWHLAIAHCNHLWRPDSQANANHVENLAKTWGISFYLQTATQPLNSEAAARNWRYQALSAIAQENHYNCVITGHTASDRAETLLYNLIRGTGADGLQALGWQRPLTDNILLVRPLLELSRTQTGQFCQEFQLPIWEDSTNQDLKYARNRIRQELIPYLRENFNSQVESALAQTAELLQAEVEYLELAAHQLRQEAMNAATDDVTDVTDNVIVGITDNSSARSATKSVALNRRGLQNVTDVTDNVIVGITDNSSARSATKSVALNRRVLQNVTDVTDNVIVGITDNSSVTSATKSVALNRRVLQKAPIALQRRVMRQVLQQILKSAPSFEQIEKLTALITAPNRSQTDPFPGGAIALVEGDWISLKNL